MRCAFIRCALIAALWAVLAVPTSVAQDYQVTGTVTDAETGQPLPGVNVVVKGTTIGTATDAKGSYELSIPSRQDTLVFSFVGYEMQTVPINGRSVVDVQLAPSVERLEKVVVVGYGQQRRMAMTGSVSSVTPEEIEHQPITRVDEALQARVPGVKVIRSGQPNGRTYIRIRGMNSLRGGNGPLIVIDGFIGGSISSVDPDDVASITVLKDASATAIYGSRGANGVVIIETKDGRVGEPRVTFESFWKASSVSKTFDLLEPMEYARLVNERDRALGAKPTFSEEELSEISGRSGTDWQDVVFQPGLTQSYTLAVSGGTPTTQYYASGHFSNVRGILLNSSYRDYAIRTNISTEVGNVLDLQLNLSGVRERHHNAGSQEGGWQGDNPLYSALSWSPLMSKYTESGTYTIPPSYSTLAPNPLFMLYERTGQAHVTNLLATTQAELALLPDLTLTVNASVRSRSRSRSRFDANRPTAKIAAAEARTNNVFVLDWQHSEVLTYDHAFGETHQLEVSAIFEQQRHSARRTNANAGDFPTLSLRYYGLGLGGTQHVNSGYSDWSLMSYLGRVNYTLLGRYLFTGTVRVDGSSRFAEGHRWGTFPSAAFAWRLSEEPFMQGLGWLDNLKLRVSWGLTGNQAIGPYATLSTLGTGQGVSLDGEERLPGVGPTAPANPDLTWETTEQIDVGLDFSVLNRRLTLTADYYVKTTRELLLSISVPAYNGYSSVLRNLGKVRNRGFEFSLTGMPVETDDWSWAATLNFSTNQNTVLDLGDGDHIFKGGKGALNVAPRFIIREGRPFPLFHGAIYLGIWQQDQAKMAAKYNKKPGDARYRDLDGDFNYDDARAIGNPNPDYRFGLSTSIRYKNITLDVLVYGVQGKQIMNISRYNLIGGGGNVRQGTGEINKDRWSPGNPDARLPAYSTTARIIPFSTFFLEDGSFIRVRNVTLGYNLPTSLLQETFVQEARVYLSAQDPITFTDYSGYDPEAPSIGSDVSRGVDSGTYPNTRAITFGFEVTF